ncbi:YdcH family protein [Shewanella aestuarii]|uniref:YdcH family protein n=1 Tax=Shewanella aestuarii TaxID=1028752 RepID=A0A6G9QHE1_9GAMM|nr:YdcH family protein [Shewanella aestuarii]QIR13485.1 YdcH family protein [Shewanella aestuarii]
MFPEYRELITKLKTSDAHFLRKFDEHNQLDEEIKQHEAHSSSDTTPEVKILKSKKLHLKEEIYQILKKHDAQSA